MSSAALPIVPLGAPPDATVHLPGSKSITNRAIVAALLAEGTSTLDGVLLADDTDAMLDCARRLGAGVDLDPAGPSVVVEGTGGRLAPGPLALDVRQAGTVARFLPPVLALGTGEYHLDGAAQMRARPMGPLVDALRGLGVVVREEGEPGHLPLTVVGGVARGRVRLPGDVSSQFLSGLMLAGPHLGGGLTVTLTTPLVSRPYAAMTAAVMDAFGARAELDESGAVVAPGRYRACRYTVEPDATAASYFFAAAVVTGGRVRVPGLGSDSLQGDMRFVDVLERMGARVTRGPKSIEVAAGGELRGVDVDLSDLSDTAPTLAVVAAVAATPTRVRGIGFIRAKESNRIVAIVEELRRCGVDAREEPDGFVVVPGTLRPAVVQTYDDHRMAMSFAVLGLRVPGIEIADPGCVAKTFPGYFDVLDGLRR